MLLRFLLWHRKYDQFTYSQDKTRWQMYHKNCLILSWFSGCLINCYQRHSERIWIVIFILNYHLSSWHLWFCFSEGLKSHWGSARNVSVSEKKPGCAKRSNLISCTADSAKTLLLISKKPATPSRDERLCRRADTHQQRKNNELSSVVAMCVVWKSSSLANILYLQ